MYPTTPRKVKQESRLRRSLSLTNASRLNGGSNNGATSTANGDDYSSGEYHRHLNDIEESKDSNTYFPFDGDLNLNNQRSRYSYTNGDGGLTCDPSFPDLVDCSNSNSNSTTNLGDNNSIQPHHNPHHQSVHYAPPPYRVPPPGEIGFSLTEEDPFILVTSSDPQHQGVPDSPISLNSLQIHSSKFPIVKEVVISSSLPVGANRNTYNQQNHQNQTTQQTSSNPNNQQIPIPVLSPEYILKFQNKKLAKKKQIEWTEERKAFTLDSKTAKDIQQRLAASYPTITKAVSSADLGKAIQDFNDEQTRLMSSMNGAHRHHMNGLDNPALDLGTSSSSLSNGHVHHHQHPQHHPSSSLGYSNNNSNNNKMSYNYSDNSSTSQSQSLSSSNTDSLDTVIFKGAPQQQSTPSIRDWQRSMESSNGGGGDFAQQNGYHHHNDDGRGSYQMQQQQHPSSSSSSSYNQMQQQGYNNPSAGLQQQQHQQQGPGGGNGSGYAIEYLGYHSQQQQHQVQQNLSVHSIPSSSGNTTLAGNSNGGVGVVRSGNGLGNTYHNGSNPQLQLAAKSPMVNRKTFSTHHQQQQQQQQQIDPSTGRGVTFNGSSAANNSSSTTSDSMLVDNSKSSSSVKDTTKFPSKTYNHIKDMISSRFGHGNGSGGGNGVNKGLNNAVNSGGNNVVHGSEQNTANSYIDLTMGVPVASYPPTGVNNNNNSSSAVNGGINGHLHTSYNATNNGMMTRNNSGPSYYHSQQQQQQQGVNMTNGNGMPPNSYRSPNMSERKNVNTSFRKAIQQSSLKSNLTEDSLQLRPILESQQQQQQGYHQHQQFSNVGALKEAVVQERAQRALDQLMEIGAAPNTTNNNNPPPSVYNRVQQFSYPQNPAPPPAVSRPLQLPARYNQVKPGPGSSNSNSSSGLQMVESSLSSPGSYNSGMNRPQAGGSSSRNSAEAEIHSHNQQWSHLQQQQQHQQQSQIPPPLPTSKKPDSPEGSINTIGLPGVIEQRENGDGSSATMETNLNGGINHLEAPSSSSTCSKVKSDQLKQITTDLQNIALSVAAEQHLHNSINSHNNNNNHSSSSECGGEKGPQRVGSGQSHTTTDSGLGTVMLTKSPLNSNSDPGEHLGSGGTDGMVIIRPNADSVSSGNDSEWVDLVEPEIRNILEIERNSKSVAGMKPPGGNGGIVGGGRPPVGQNSNGLSLNGGGGVSSSTSTSAVTKQFQSTTSSGGSVLKSHPGGSNNNSTNPNNGNNINALMSGSSSKLPDISPLSPIIHVKTLHHSPNTALSPKVPKKFDLNNVYSKKALRSQSQELLAGPSTSQGTGGGPLPNKIKSPRVPAKVQRSNSGSGQQRWPTRPQRVPEKSPKMGGGGGGSGSRPKEYTQTFKGAKITRNAMTKLGHLLNSLQDETGDLTSTTGLDFESAFDGHTEFTTDDDDLSTTIDTTDAHAIRRQLESLESMYTEVLKVLGEKKFSNRNRYPPNTAELRAAKRRPFGSMSSLPSSVSSRPFRERSRKLEDKKKVKDLKSINRRFQRLESHVVTLARSVAHLSSEMRTQHLMVQEMEAIRNELQTLRNQVVKNSAQTAQNFNRAASGRHGANPCANQTDWTSFRNALPSLTNPCRVRKLTQFFGDEPPLIRIFLKKLGYEKYASAFEQERIGIMELPYLTEERLNKMGIPMGPRLRILQEAQICLKPGGGHHSHHQNNHNAGNLSVYVV